MIRAFACLTVLLSIALPLSAARYALLIGNAQGGSETEGLQYVANDLRGMRDILTNLGGFDPQNIVTVYNKSPRDLDAALRQLSLKVSAASDDLFFLYYSGHADQGALHFGDQRFPLTQLRAALDTMPARIRIAVLDACQSGGVTRTKGGRLEEPFLFKEDSKVKGLVVLYSSSPTENSQESDKYRNSIFTFHFLNALRGLGDVSQDGKITVNEAYQYSYNRTVSSTVQSASGVQHPGYQFRIQGEGDIVLADLNLRTQGLLFDRGIAGPVTILDSSETIVADFVKEQDAAFAVALNTGRYRVVVGRGTARTQATARVAAGGIARLRLADFAPAPAGEAGTAKGAEPRRHVTLSACAGAGVYDFASVTGELDARFGDYAIFGMAPRFSLPRGLARIGGGLDVELSGGVLLLWSGDFAWVDDTRAWDGARVDAISGTSFGSRLEVSQSLRMLEISTGPGYRLQRTFLAGLSAQIGVCVEIVDFRVASTFTDSLFDVQATGNIRETGALLLPFGSLAYVVPLGEKFSIGARIRYRYQGSASHLGLTDNPEFRYGLGGVDGSICIGLRLGGGTRE